MSHTFHSICLSACIKMSNFFFTVALVASKNAQKKKNIFLDSSARQSISRNTVLLNCNVCTYLCLKLCKMYTCLHTFLMGLVLSATVRQTASALRTAHTVPSTWVLTAFHFVFAPFPFRLPWRFANFAMQQIVKRMQRMRKANTLFTRAKCAHDTCLTRLHWTRCH